jgi:hypothetical protein
MTLLGPVTAIAGSTDLPLGTPQQRGLLALLLLRDAPVPIDEVVAALWGEQPPRSAHGTVRTYVARLRHVLGDAVVLRHSSAGYRLHREGAELDVAEFIAQAERGTALPETPERSVREVAAMVPMPLAEARAALEDLLEQSHAGHWPHWPSSISGSPSNQALSMSRRRMSHRSSSRIRSAV